VGELFEAISPFLLNNEDSHKDSGLVSSTSANSVVSTQEDAFKMVRSPSDHKNSSVYGEVKLTEKQVSELGRIIMTELLDNFDSVFLVYLLKSQDLHVLTSHTGRFDS
jgi:hypothetical protein